MLLRRGGEARKIIDRPHDWPSWNGYLYDYEKTEHLLRELEHFYLSDGHRIANETLIELHKL